MSITRKKCTVNAIMPMPLTQAELLDIFCYDETSGFLSWKNPSKQRRQGHIGKKAKTRYVQIGINYKVYLAHRIIFMMFHGYCPKEIDHINGDCRDNRIENLRDSTRSCNTLNRKSPIRNNSSGHTGVSLCSATGLWRAYAKKNGVCLEEKYESKDDAINARKNLVIKLYGKEFYESLLA